MCSNLTIVHEGAFFLSVELEKQPVRELVGAEKGDEVHIEDLHVADDESAERENAVVESDNNRYIIPEGNYRIYFEESDIYYAPQKKTLLERKVKLKT